MRWKENKALKIFFPLLLILLLLVIYQSIQEFKPSGPTYLDLEKQLCLDNITNVVAKKPSRPCPKGGIVTVHQGGRLGNQLFEYAAMWAHAKETELEAFAPRCIHNRISKLLKTLPHPSMEEISGCPVDMNNFVHYSTQWKKGGQSISLPRYCTEEKLISKWSRYIPKEFTIRDNLLETSHSHLHEAKKKNTAANVFVGVHVRRTDYTKYISNKYHGKPAGKEFFLKAMEYYEKKFSNVIFVVTSDDRGWCRENLGNKSNIYIVPAGSPEGDLALMSCCNHSIFDYGTYGAWGAFYAAGETVYHDVPTFMTKKIHDVLPSWHTL